MQPNTFTVALIVGLLTTVHLVSAINGVSHRRFLHTSSISNNYTVQVHINGGGSAIFGTTCGNYLCRHGYCSLSIFNGVQSNRCICYHGWTGSSCNILKDQPSTSSTMKTTVPTTVFARTSESPKITTTRVNSAIPVCYTNSVLAAVVKQRFVENPNAIECSPGNHSSHEAIPLSFCAVPQTPSLWKPGVKVTQFCRGSVGAPTVPKYSPIAAFDNGIYSSIGSVSGIFVGCTAEGIKIIIQRCGKVPGIVEILNGGINTQDPNNYYTIS